MCALPRRARRKREVARDSGVIVSNNDAMASHRLKDLQAERADNEFGWLQRCPTRAMEGILPALYGKAQATVQYPQIGVTAHCNAEIESSVPIVSVIPEAVVMKAITGGGVKNRLSGLVNRVIVKL